MKKEKEANKKIFLGFMLFLFVITFLFYSFLEKEIVGRAIFIEKAEQENIIRGVFVFPVKTGECIPARAVVTFDFLGIERKITFSDFVKIGKANIPEYYASFYVSNTPIKGIGRCFGVPGKYSVSEFLKIHGFGEKYLGEEYPIVFDLSAVKMYIPEGISGQYPLEINIEYQGIVIYSEIVEVSIGKTPKLIMGEGVDIVITSNFDQGNLFNVTHIGNNIFKAQIRMSNFSLDPTTPARYQWWFYFKVENCANKNFVVNITNLLDEDIWNINGSLGNRWRNIWPVYSFDNNETWYRLNPLELNSTNWFKLYEVEGNNSYFIINVSFPTCPVWIAALPPYPLGRSFRLTEEAKKYYTYVDALVIGTTEGGRNITMLSITDKNYDDSTKKKILVVSGQHATGESQGSYAIEGMINYLLGKAPLAAQIRRNTIVKIVHLASPDASFLGIPRFNLRDEDLNREWNQPLPPDINNVSRMSQTTYALKQQRISWLPDVMLDLHGSINDDVNYFIYVPAQAENATHYQKVWNLMNNISFYPNGSVRWLEYSSNFRRVQYIQGAAVRNSYNENKTLALLIEFAPNCRDGGTPPEGNANISTCIKEGAPRYLVTINDWKEDGRLILEGTYSYLCFDGSCINQNLPPAITAKSPENKTYYGRNLTFEVLTNEIVSSCWVNLNDSVNITLEEVVSDPYSWRKNISLLPGQYAAVFYCNDTEGMIGNSSKIYFTVFMNTAPILILNLPVNNTIFYMSNVNFNFTAIDYEDNVLSCSIFLDNVLNKTNNSVLNNTLTNFLISGITYGMHTWSVNCSDNNLSSASELRYFFLQPSGRIILNFPSRNHVFSPGTEEILFNWTATSIINTEMNCSINITDFYFNTISCVNGTYSIVNISGFQAGKTYTWKVNCSDALSQFFSESRIFRIERGGASGGSGPENRAACGNGICETGETQDNCCEDCGCNQGICIENVCVIVQPYCGDGKCEANETQETCCKDCGCPERKVCRDNICQAISFCGDRICQENENLANCLKDCFDAYCGNNVCDREKLESPENCCKDCGCVEGKICKNNKCIEKKEINFLVVFVVLVFVAAILVFLLIKIKKAKEIKRRYHLRALIPETS
ncbi:MAG: M14-type cytosolic carboxypeptidase [Candidatus Pacearchaeota archaeon]|nr:M14-type cytosolic carboxypeptidase [Candidatus Pacearchaeota archaeon]